jgi:hypothetical protein
LSVAAHQVRGTYYYNAAGTQVKGNGHPSDKWGWAAQGGVQIKLPWGAGDTFTVHGVYAEGANHYVYTDVAQSYGLFDGANVFGGLNYDSVYGLAGGNELTKSWGFNAGVEHYWTRPCVRRCSARTSLSTTTPLRRL